MGIRETLHKNPSLTTGATAGVILVTLMYVIYAATHSSQTAVGPQMYFTDDDGKTFFSDSANNLAPFDHDGKQAVRCHVYVKAGSDTRWIGYLERYTAAGKAKIVNPSGWPDPMAILDLDPHEVEVSKPGAGDGGWVTKADPKARIIMGIKPPDGSKVPVMEVDP